ncbi:MAG: hypothetical protein HYZ42_05300 [Bacteroidetes bacterium]|nr:hypothetical protein [Bacteroidota bacterium]
MKKIIYIILVILCSQEMQAQTITSSPYSRFALGDLQFAGFTRNTGLGQTGQALRNKYYINPTNSASYSNLQFTSFESGMTYNTGNYSNANSKQTFNTGSLSYLSLGFPLSIKRAIGGAFGLAPFSSSEYNFRDSNLTGAAPYRIYNTGTGGLSKLFFGVGKDFFKHLSIGAQGNYIFGQTESNINYLMPLDSNFLGVKTNRNTKINGLIFDVSTQLHFNIDDTIWDDKKDVVNRKYHVKYYNLTAGASANLGNNLKGNEVFTAYRANGSYIDTIANVNNKKGNIYIPFGWQAGIMFQEYDHWLVTFDYATRQWSKYTSFNNNDKLVDDVRYSLGFSWVPNIKASNEFAKKSGRTFKNYMKLVEYRFGARYANTNLMLNNVQIKEMAGSFGLGFPIKKVSRNEVARINFSAEYIQRGTTDNGLIKENYMRLMVGVTFNDQWFIVRKIY